MGHADPGKGEGRSGGTSVVWGSSGQMQLDPSPGWVDKTCALFRCGPVVGTWLAMEGETKGGSATVPLAAPIPRGPREGQGPGVSSISAPTSLESPSHHSCLTLSLI